MELHYVKNIFMNFKELKTLAEKAFDQLDTENYYYSPHPTTNNIAIIIQHLSGNMKSRWTNFLTDDGEKPWRERDKEFEERELTIQQLMQLWEDGWKELFNTLNIIRPHTLLSKVSIRNKKYTVVEAINRQLVHYAYHVGQIVYIAKSLKKDKWISLSIPKKN